MITIWKGNPPSAVGFGSDVAERHCMPTIWSSSAAVPRGRSTLGLDFRL